MKSLNQFITEAAAPKKGQSTWKKVFNIIINSDENEDVTKNDIKEVQEDEWIWDGMTGDIAEVDSLWNLYNKSGDTKVYWEFDEDSNEYTVSDDEDNSIFFMVSEPYKNGI